jgi:hypothetical protein
MTVTRENVALQLASYLHRQSTLESLVDWSESQMLEGEFESTVVRDVVARLGLADVRAFGLTWHDCQQLLDDLGYTARIEIEA